MQALHDEPIRYMFDEFGDSTFELAGTRQSVFGLIALLKPFRLHNG
jgi:hypothetical protein